MCEGHGLLGLCVRGGGGDTLVKRHDDVAPDSVLHGDAGFRREQVRGPIDITLETGTVFVHASRVGERKNLKATGVGEHWAIPVHEAVDATEPLKGFRPRAQQQVVGISQ
jgi:hypothetical protein